MSRKRKYAICPHCGQRWTARFIWRHLRACVVRPFRRRA